MIAVGGNGFNHLLGQIFDKNQGGDEDIGFGDIFAKLLIIFRIPQLFNQVAIQFDRQAAVLFVDAGGGSGEGVLILGLQYHINSPHQGPTIAMFRADSAVGGADLGKHAAFG